MRLPWVSRAVYEAQIRQSIDNTTRAMELLNAERARYDALLDKYHEAVRPQPAFTPAQAPVKVLGPKTHLALQEMGRGQSREVRIGMQTKALSLHEEGMTDEQIAARVRKGEPVPL